jgi:uncharacterized protein YbaA (DUF1428 family)
MSGKVNPSSYVIGRQSDVSGGGYYRPQQKRARITRAIKAKQQECVIKWEEENSEETSSNTRTKKRTTPKATDKMLKAIQGLKQLLEQDFNRKIEIIKAEFQLKFTKL